MKIKKSIILLLVTVLVCATATVGFADIDYSQWDSVSAYPKDLANTQLLSYARAFIDRGVITGDPDGLFHPERNINRAEYAAIIARATNNSGAASSLENKTYFKDLKGYNWARGYINVCYEKEYIKGIGQSKYNPGGNVTYVEVIAVLLRAKGVTDKTINSYGEWPNNYIKYARIYNMTGSVVIRDWNVPANKGDVVKLSYVNLPKTTATKATLTIKSDPAVPVSSGGVTFSAIVLGSGIHSYQWYFNDKAIDKATKSNFVTLGFTSVGAFHVRVTTAKSGYADSLVISSDINVK